MCAGRRFYVNNWTWIEDLPNQPLQLQLFSENEAHIGWDCACPKLHLYVCQMPLHTTLLVKVYQRIAIATEPNSS